MLKCIDYSQARDILSRQPVNCCTETLPLGETLGRVTAGNITAAISVPPYDKSPFDGYAFRSEETPGRLLIVGESAAGTGALSQLKPGTAMRIFTGAPIPPGADAVAKQESVEIENDEIVVQKRFFAGENVIRSGEDIEQGAPIVQVGTKLSPAHLGVLASIGAANVTVYRKPLAVIINTGSELAEPGSVLSPFGIYNSGRYTLSGLLQCLGFTVEEKGILPDDRDLIASTVDQAMASPADIVLTTGGASVGDYDYSLYTAERLKAEILFWKLNMKPGGAMLAAKKNDKLYLGLSGNPAAAMMSLLLVAQPHLRKLTGAAVSMEELELPLQYALPKVSGVTRLLRGHMVFNQDGQAFFSEHIGRGNGTIRSFAHCDSIGIVSAGSPELPAGAKIKVLRLPPDLCC